MSGKQNSISIIRRILLTLLVFYCGFCFSQTNAVIEYKLETNADLHSSSYATLHIKGSTTIFLDRKSTTVYKESGVSISKSEDYQYFKIDHLKNKILFIDAIGWNYFLIEDALYDRNWVISEEKKNISGYECVKATIIFRGVEWEAWFAPEIPLPYGPWKLYGLPGLIMEVYDEELRYTWRAEKIEYKESDIFSKDFTLLVQLKNNNAIPFRQYLTDMQEYMVNTMQEHDPRVNVPDLSRIGFETKYEWDPSE